MKIIAGQLEQVVNEYKVQFFAMNESELSFKPDNGKWSKKEIIGHLIDSAQNNIRRFIITQYQSDAHVVYMQDDWVIAQDYVWYNTANLITLWELLNKHLIIILKKIPEDKYMLRCNTGKGEDKFNTLEFLANDYITHQLHHLKQIVQ